MQKIIFSFLIFGFLYSMSAFANEKIIIDAEDDWAPYSSINLENPEGYAVDLVKAIFNAVHVDVELRAVSYAKCINDIKLKSDVNACFNTAKNKANETLYLWPSTPLFTAKVLIWGLSNSTAKGWQYKDLIGKKVGVTNGYEYGAKFDTAKPPIIVKDIGISDQLLFKKLAQNRFKYAVAYEYPSKHVLSDPDMKDIKKIVKPIGELSEQQLYVSFSKTNPKSAQFIALYNKGQSIIEKNGELKKITDSFVTKYQ